MTELIRISEIFGPTLQGEGALIGQPSIFVRTGGCDYRCAWCDTPHAVDSKFRALWKPMTAAAIMADIETRSGGKPMLVSLTGGNPAIHPLGGLIRMGKSKNYRFALETQGSIAQDWFADLDTLILSPKPPSSTMDTNWDKFDDCLAAAGDKPNITLKIVVFDEDDYAYAQDAAARYPHLPLYLQPGNDPLNHALAKDTSKLQWLAEKVTNDNWHDAHVLPQLHVMIWGNQRGK